MGALAPNNCCAWFGNCSHSPRLVNIETVNQ
jgi:hypothetical protein